MYAALVVRPAGSVAGSDITVGEPTCYPPVGVGDGTVVEVAADDDAHTLVAFPDNLIGNGVGL